MTIAALKSAGEPVQPDLDIVLPQIANVFAETAAAYDRNGLLPFANFEHLHAKGLLALTAPARLGGGGADLTTALRVIAAVGKGEPATALVLVMQYLVHAGLDSRSGWPEHLKQLVVRTAVEEGALINALRVERDLGTPARGGLPATIAKRTPEGWRLSGRKIYSTGAPGLRWFVVWARTDDETPLVGGWLVDARSGGISIEETWDHLGLRASASHDVVFDDVLVPLDHALEPRPAGVAPPQAPAFMSWLAVLTGGLYDGVAQAARDWLVGYLVNRRPSNLGASLSTLPRFQEAVGHIDALLLSNRALLERAAARPANVVEAALVKHLVTENAIKAVEKAVEVIGNPGLTRENPLERHLRDVLCGRIHTPQADVALSGAGRVAFADFAL